MPQLEWDNTDFLEFFATEPVIEEYGVWHNYEIERDGLKLLLTIWQLDSVIQASLYRGKSEVALVTFAAYVRGSARFINDDRGRYINFEDCIIVPGRFWYIQAGDAFAQGGFPPAITIRLSIDPDVAIVFTDYECRT